MAIPPVTFQQLPADRQFYALITVLGLLIGLGLWAFAHLEHSGHVATGMNNQVVWGLPHVFAIFLIVTASGALNIGSIGTVFGKQVYQPWARLSALLAISLLIGGLMILLLDLGRPDRLLIAMTHYHFTSIFAWNMILYSGFLLLAVGYLSSMLDRKLKRFYQTFGWSLFIWRLVLTSGTGSIFGFLVARDAYNSAILAPLFIALSLTWGLALFLLVVYALQSWVGTTVSKELRQRLRGLLATFIATVLLLELVRHLSGLYSAERSAAEQYLLWKGGFYSALFWVGQIIIGSLAPLSLIFYRPWKQSVSALLIAAAGVLLGGLAQLYALIISGQTVPLSLFAGAEIASDYFDGVMATYIPTVWEWLLAIGGIGLALLLMLLGIKFARIIPSVTH